MFGRFLLFKNWFLKFSERICRCDIEIGFNYNIILFKYLFLDWVKSIKKFVEKFLVKMVFFLK